EPGGVRVRPPAARDRARGPGARQRSAALSPRSLNACRLDLPAGKTAPSSGSGIPRTGSIGRRKPARPRRQDMTRPGNALAIAVAGQDDDQAALEERTAFFHDAVTDWLADPGITIVCGRWADGAIAEFMPAGTAKLLPPAYPGRFAGIRELRLEQQQHHLHIDLGRVHALSYVVAPSVCLGFDPSLELRLLVTDEAGAPTEHWMLALMYANPYLRDRRVDPKAAGRFFQAAREHLARRPDLVRVDISPEVASNAHAGALFDCLAKASGQSFEGIDWA